MVCGGPMPSRTLLPQGGTRRVAYTGSLTKETHVFDYLRIMINARLAKMDERGASAVEYGLLVAGIAAIIVAVVFLLGDTLEGVFSNTNSSIANG